MVLTGEVQPLSAALGHNLYLFTFLLVHQAGSQSERMATAINWKTGKNKWARMATYRLPRGSFFFPARASMLSLIAHPPTTDVWTKAYFTEIALCCVSRGVIICFP